MKSYLELGRKILEKGEKSTDRTGTGTLSLFGEQLRFDLREGFPILTTKKVNMKPLIAELLWFLKGDTNTSSLDSKIWDEWAGEDGELGRIYGAHWRSWNGEEVKNPDGQSWYHGGFDQIENALEMIKNSPDSRRIIVTAWDADKISEAALPACHCFFQFRVYGEFLDLQLYQRSADYAIGVPFNISSYALLLEMFANECGLTARNFVHTFGDVHLYLNHLEKFEKQLKKPTHKLPTLELPQGKKVLEIVSEDIKLIGYKHEKWIKYPVAV